MLQMVTAASPSPMVSPTTLARSPVKTTMTAEMISITPMTAVTPSRIGRVFQIGRPSGTS